MSIGDSGWLLIFCSHIVGELIAQILSNIFSYDKICASVYFGLVGIRGHHFKTKRMNSIIYLK